MEEIEIWAIEDSEVVPVERAKMDLESSLEDTLAANPRMLLPNLKLVGRQMPVADGFLDLLGVDDEGKLAVFELKRGTLTRDAVAQVIDYGSALEAMSETELARRVVDNSGSRDIDKIEDFEEWYREEFGESLDLLRPLSMFLVGLGADETTRRMVDFLAEAGLDISLISFYGFDYGDKTLLVKQVQVESALSSITSNLAKAERLSALEKRAEELAASDLWKNAKHLIWDDWHRIVQGKNSGLYEDPRANGITFKLPVRKESGATSSLAFLAIELINEPSGIEIVYYPRAVDLCKDKFDQHNNGNGSFESRRPLHAAKTERVDEEVFLRLGSIDELEERKEVLSELTQDVFRSWMMGVENPRPNENESSSL